MSRDRVMDFALRVGPILVMVGIAWGVLSAQVSSKVSVPRFQLESADVRNRSDARFDAMSVRLQQLQAGVDKANARLSKLVCRGNPDPTCE